MTMHVQVSVFKALLTDREIHRVAEHDRIGVELAMGGVVGRTEGATGVARHKRIRVWRMDTDRGGGRVFRMTGGNGMWGDGIELGHI